MKKDKLAKSFLKVFGFSVVAVGFILANSYLLFGLQILLTKGINIWRLKCEAPENLSLCLLLFTF